MEAVILPAQAIVGLPIYALMSQIKQAYQTLKAALSAQLPSTISNKRGYRGITDLTDHP